MAAAEFNFILEHGVKKTLRFTLQNKYGVFPLTGYTAKSQTRESDRSPIVLIEQTTENGGILIDPVSGSITLIYSENDIAKLYANSQMDLFIYAPGGSAKRVIFGEITLKNSVTQ